MPEKGKSTDSLMRHIRDTKVGHNIDIGGSRDKKDLLMMGYYHGYKGYRFARNVNNKLPITKFKEITAIYNFDMALKSLFYSPIMKLETAIKNYIIDALVSGDECSYEVIFDKKLNFYKTVNPSDRNYNFLVKKRLELRKKMHTTILFEYGNDNPVIQNFVHKDKPIPLWAVFEVISLGTLGSFFQCLNIGDRKKILQSLGILDPNDTNGELLSRHVWIIKELRNALAHNHIIFDCRFKNSKIPTWIRSHIESQMGITNCTFNTITEYLALSVFYMKSIGMTKVEIKAIVRDYEGLVRELQKSVPTPVFNTIVGTDVFNKIKAIKEYI